MEVDVTEDIVSKLRSMADVVTSAKYGEKLDGVLALIGDAEHASLVLDPTNSEIFADLNCSIMTQIIFASALIKSALSEINDNLTVNAALLDLNVINLALGLYFCEAELEKICGYIQRNGI